METSARASSSPPFSPARRLGRGAAVVFLMWTALAILWTMVPVESATRRATRGWFDRFRQWTGLEQHWDMFVTVPYYHDYRVTVEVTPPGPSGARATVGPVLPGLRVQPEYFRYRTFFSRLEDRDYPGYLAAYGERLGRELAAAHPEWRGGTFQIRKRGERIQPLATIRDLGEIAFEQTVVNGPYPIPLDPEN